MRDSIILPTKAATIAWARDFLFSAGKPFKCFSTREMNLKTPWEAQFSLVGVFGLCQIDINGLPAEFGLPQLALEGRLPRFVTHSVEQDGGVAFSVAPARMASTCL